MNSEYKVHNNILLDTHYNNIHISFLIYSHSLQLWTFSIFLFFLLYYMTLSLYNFVFCIEPSYLSILLSNPSLVPLNLSPLTPSKFPPFFVSLNLSIYLTQTNTHTHHTHIPLLMYKKSTAAEQRHYSLCSDLLAAKFRNVYYKSY